MNVTEKFASVTCAPSKPLYTTSANRATPTSPASHSTTAGTRNSRRRRGSWSCGLLHIVESAPKETTSTIAAVQLNSHTGIGRSALPTIPCASAFAGSARATTARPASSNGSRRRGGALMPAAVYASTWLRLADSGALAYADADAHPSPRRLHRDIGRRSDRGVGDRGPALRPAHAHPLQGRGSGFQRSPGLLLRRPRPRGGRARRPRADSSAPAVGAYAPDDRARRPRRAVDRARPHHPGARAVAAHAATRAPACVDTPRRRLPAVAARPLRLAPARALSGRYAPQQPAGTGARDVPRAGDQHVDVPVRPATKAGLVWQRSQARLRACRAPHGRDPREHLPVVWNDLLPLLPDGRGSLSHLSDRRSEHRRGDHAGRGGDPHRVPALLALQARRRRGSGGGRAARLRDAAPGARTRVGDPGESQPPATAGRIVSSAPSRAGVARPSRKRMSSPARYTLTKRRRPPSSSAMRPRSSSCSANRPSSTSCTVAPSICAWASPPAAARNCVGIFTTTDIRPQPQPAHRPRTPRPSARSSRSQTSRAPRPASSGPRR